MINWFRHRFDPLPVLQSERLLLRGIDEADAGSIVEFTTYDGVPARDEPQALEFLERIRADAANGETLHWGICNRRGTEVMGTCGFYRGFPDNCGEIGYILGSPYRGRGFMAEAVGLIVDFGFRTLKLSRVIAMTSPENAASIAVLERAGFHRAKAGPGELTFATRPTQRLEDGGKSRR